MRGESVSSPLLRGSMARVRLAGADFAVAGFSCPLCFLSPCVIISLPNFTLFHCTLSVFLPGISTMPSLLLCFSLVIKVSQTKCVLPFIRITAICIFPVNVHILFLGMFVFSSCRDLRALCIWRITISYMLEIFFLICPFSINCACVLSHVQLFVTPWL